MGTVSTTEGTYLANLFDPQVIGDRINQKLFDLIRFAPLADVHNNLVGRPGSTITLPYYNSIGVAQLIPEGTDIPISQLTESTKEVTIAKYGKGVQITDEAVLSAYGDPIGEAVDQIAKAIAQAVDNNILALMASQKHLPFLVKTSMARRSCSSIRLAIRPSARRTVGFPALKSVRL